MRRRGFCLHRHCLQVLSLSLLTMPLCHRCFSADKDGCVFASFFYSANSRNNQKGFRKFARSRGKIVTEKGRDTNFKRFAHGDSQISRFTHRKIRLINTLLQQQEILLVLLLLLLFFNIIIIITRIIIFYIASLV